ncbi:MAG TPA: plastocyanin/azurin family copper-binding protein [Actinomycetes bacterium]
MPVPLRRPSRLALAALLVAALGVALLALSSPPAAAQAKDPVIQGTAQFKWEPADVTIKPGQSVTFKVASGPPHPVVSGDGSNPAGDNKFDASGCGTDKMGTVGASCTVKFPKAGTFPYFCQVHVSLGMKGVIQVGSSGSAPTTTAAGGGGGGTQQVIPPPEAGAPTKPGKPAVFWAGYGLLALGALLFLAALAGYIRYAPSFRRESRNR